MTQATTTTQENAISEVDRDAFKRAIAIMSRHKERVYRTDFKRRLDQRQEPWVDIGRHAASAVQSESLGLKPWQVAPCVAELNTADAPGFEHRCTRNASLRFWNGCLTPGSAVEPDPIKAIERIEREPKLLREAARHVRSDTTLADISPDSGLGSPSTGATYSRTA